MNNVVVLATQDTKRQESDFLCERLAARGVRFGVIDTTPTRWIDDSSHETTRAELMETAGCAIARQVGDLVQRGECAGIVIIAGASGAALTREVLRRAPYGLPKILLSPVVSGDVTSYIGTSDTILVPPVVDFTGRNAYVDFVLDRAATLLAGLLKTDTDFPKSPETHFAATAFGVTSPLLAQLEPRVRAEGLHLATFSTNGVGGQAFERFLQHGLVGGAFDLTLSELADELCGGVLSAGPQRATSAAALGVPQVVAPGGLDFVNFGPPATVPEKLKSRKYVTHTSSVTLLRTSAEENAELAGIVAGRLNGATNDNTVLILPRKGFSRLSGPGGPFWDPEADDAFIQTVRAELRDIEIVDVEANINDAATATAVLQASEDWRGGKRDHT